MTKQQLIKFLKNNEWDIQNARASFSACDLVYRSYAQSNDIHKLDYAPVLYYGDFR